MNTLKIALLMVATLMISACAEENDIASQDDQALRQYGLTQRSSQVPSTGTGANVAVQQYPPPISQTPPPTSPSTPPPSSTQTGTTQTGSCATPHGVECPNGSTVETLCFPGVSNSPFGICPLGVIASLWVCDQGQWTWTGAMGRGTCL